MKEGIVLSLTGFYAFLLYFIVSTILITLFSFLYTWVTPYREFKLISEGNLAAACSFSGALLGFAIPLASAIAHSAGLLDMIIWGIIGSVIQLVTFFFVKRLFPAIVSDIPANQLSKGVFLGVVSLVAGIINAACMVY